MSLPVGTRVRLKAAMLGSAKGDVGIVFNDYGTGSQVIFTNGEYDGFSDSEIEAFLEVLEQTSLSYRFTNVIRLNRDFDAGVFTPYLGKDYHE